MTVKFCSAKEVIIESETSMLNKSCKFAYAVFISSAVDVKCVSTDLFIKQYWISETIINILQHNTTHPLTTFIEWLRSWINISTTTLRLEASLLTGSKRHLTSVYYCTTEITFYSDFGNSAFSKSLSLKIFWHVIAEKHNCNLWH